MEEFFKQGDKEQEQGLDFSPLCDRQNTMVPQSQIGEDKKIFVLVSPRTDTCDVSERVMSTSAILVNACNRFTF